MSTSASASLSAHVLDAALGVPAAGLGVTVLGPDGTPLATTTTDADGRVRLEQPIGPGTHALVLATGSWFAEQGRSTFYPSVHVTFQVGDGEAAPDDHYHVAVLLSPYAYTTYRGS